MTAVRDSFHAQARACESLGSPLTARILHLLADHIAPGSPLSDRLLNWPNDPTSKGDALALRLAGGLHALVLQGKDDALRTLYQHPDTVTDTAATQILRATLATHAPDLNLWLNSPPQTNEVRRSAPLIAASHWLTSHFHLPLVLSELGASAGANLLFDHYALNIQGQTYGPANAPLTLTPDWHGPLPPQTPPQISARAGVDLNPLDPVNDRLRLMAYTWADQKDRLARLSAALDTVAKYRPQITQADAIDWLSTRLATPFHGTLHLVFHTVAWQYFPPATQALGLERLNSAGSRATPNAPLAHLAMEADATLGGAALTLRLWPGNRTIPLGRADFHGRWVNWQPPQ